MPWWLDALLLVSAALLWFSGSADRDDVWGLLLKMLAGIALLVVLLGIFVAWFLYSRRLFLRV